MNKDLDILIAHPDDEVIFGWPVLRRARRIIAIVSDENNSSRTWCARRAEALQAVGKQVGADVVCLGYNSEFYRMATRTGELWDVARKVLDLIGLETLPLFSHNPWGEYGHIDHILTHQIARITARPLIVTDMVSQAGWIPVAGWPPGQAIGAPVEMTEEDVRLYSICEMFYRERGCWTWSKPPIKQATLYAIDNSRIL